HGRDIFAPAAAHLANGVPLSKLGPRAINLVRRDFGSKLLDPKYPEDAGPQIPQESRIIHIDHFGNLILSLTRQNIEDPDQITFIIGDHTIKSLSSTFADVAE